MAKLDLVPRTRKPKKSALEIVSAIGAMGFDLQFYADSEIASAVKLLRTVNPEMFDWICEKLAAKDGQ